jgi:hypothetical protein
LYLQLKTVTFAGNNNLMSTRDKLIKRFLAMPKDFTFDEMIRLFVAFGFEVDNKGGTSGSRLALVNRVRGLSYNMHRPHPDNAIKMYVMRQVMEFMVETGLIEKEK